jgi:hypothetical protein
VIVGGHSSTGHGLARYLTAEKNERAEVWNIRGCELPDLSEAVQDWRIDGLGTKAEKPVYHAWLRPSDTDRPLSREEWETAISHFEKEMGFENQPRAVIYHHGHGQGEQGHVHLVYSRIEDGRAIPDSWNYVHHQKARAEIEKSLGLEHVYSPHLDNEPRRAQSFDRDQIEQGKRTKIDPREVKAEVSELYRAADTGPAFVAALEDAGYTLAQGDKRGYVILDEAGGVHSLSRAASVKAGELRDRLKDCPLQNLPTVEAARELIHDRAQGRESDRDREAWEDRLAAAAIAKEEREQKFIEPQPAKAAPKPEKELKGTAADIRLAYALSDTGQSFAAALDERGLILAQVSKEEAERSYRTAAFAKELGRRAPVLEAGEPVVINERGHLYRLTERTTGDERGEIDKFLGPVDRVYIPTVTEARAMQKEHAKEERAEARDIERQAFVAVSGVGLLEAAPKEKPAPEIAAPDHAAPETDSKINTITRDIPAAAEKIADGILDIAGKAAEVVSGILESIIAPEPAKPPPTPEQIARTEAAAEAREEQRTKTAADRWREAIQRIQQEQEQGQEQEREEKRRRERDGGRER